MYVVGSKCFQFNKDKMLQFKRKKLKSRNEYVSRNFCNYQIEYPGFGENVLVSIQLSPLPSQTIQSCL